LAGSDSSTIVQRFIIKNKMVDKQQADRIEGTTYHQDTERKKGPEAIPMLCYGPSNNFMKFREGLANKALLDFGNLRSLIKLGSIVLPDQPDRETYGLVDALDVSKDN
jgi:hypothetical protein